MGVQAASRVSRRAVRRIVGRWVVAVVGVEGCEAGGRRDGVIVCELSSGQKVFPVAHFVVDECSKVDARACQSL